MLLEAKNIYKKYSSGFRIENISISLDKGESIAVMGKSGSGKSSLLRLLSQMDAPDSGSVIYKGVEHSSALLADLGYIFQFPERQLFEKTAALDIAFALRHSGLSEDDVQERVLDASRLSGFPDSLLHRNPFTLSGGEARKAALSGIYVKDPELFILDEASAGLDPVSRERFMQTIMDFRGKGAGIIAATHSSDEAASFDKILVLENGRSVFFGSVSDAFSSSEMARSVTLEPPFALAFSEKLRARGIDVPLTYREAELLAALDMLNG